MFSLYVDPGELKRDSKFIKCQGIRQLSPIPSPGLEQLTGADIMISPSGLPNPANNTLLKLHLDRGAILVQLKFGFDLIASIVDGRLKQSQAKMLSTGASQSQIVLLFIGLIFEPDKENGKLMINGTYARDIVPMAKNFKYVHYLEQRRKYALRGGIFEHITLENSLKIWIESAARTVNIRPVVNVFEPKQTMDLINDWRNLLIDLPGIGEQKAMDIFNWLDNKSFYGFLDTLENGNIKEVAGIGPATIEKIKIYLKGE